MAEATGDTGVPGAACMINALPDDLLLRIISYLDSREAVHTCVLSRRWRDLWRFMPRINASCREFRGMAGTDEERDALFKKFLSRFLMLRNPIPLDEFRLCYNVPWETSDIVADSADANLWIGYALQCSVRSVKVSGRDARLYLQPAMFASGCFLTKLDLFYVVLLPGFFQNIQTGCTALEHLLLSDCCVEDVEISSQTLKVFTIDEDSNFTSYGQPIISIPSLVHLAYSVSERTPILNNMESLLTASVSVGTDHTQVYDIFQFLSSLSGVTNLNFNYIGKTLEMQSNFQWCPNFNNLTVLTLGDWCLRSAFYALIVFLQNSPNLTKLILEIRERPDRRQKFNGELEKRHFTCGLLKIVEIVCPEDWEDGPMLNNLKNFLAGNGISPDQIEIINWEWL